MNNISSYNGITGELVCYAPPGEEVLRVIEPDLSKANVIDRAIQEAFRKGSILGRLQLQRAIEQRMDELNRG